MSVINSYCVDCNIESCDNRLLDKSCDNCVNFDGIRSICRRAGQVYAPWWWCCEYIKRKKLTLAGQGNVKESEND